MTTATHLVLDRLHRPAPILAGDLPPRFDNLVRQGLVTRGETARGLACGHCEEGCWVEPLLHRHPRDGMILVHPCIGVAEGGLLAYLDINRELRGIEGGERFRFGSEAAIDGFELFGDRVRYRSPLGMTVVASRRRTWVY